MSAPNFWRGYLVVDARNASCNPPVDTHEVAWRAGESWSSDVVIANDPLSLEQVRRQPHRALVLAAARCLDVDYGWFGSATRVARVPVFAGQVTTRAMLKRCLEAGARGAVLAADLWHDVEQRRSCRALFAARDEPLPWAALEQAVPVLNRTALHELALMSSDLGSLVALGLPARFRPLDANGLPAYRVVDLLDVLYVLDKRPDETWAQWHIRCKAQVSSLVRLTRRRTNGHESTVV